MKKRHIDENQLSFDFGLSNTIDTIDRLQAAINEEDEYDNGQQLSHSRRANSEQGNPGHDSQGTLQPVRMEDPGQVGNELTRAIASPGKAANSPSGSSVSATGTGEKNHSGSQAGSAEEWTGRTRNSGRTGSSDSPTVIAKNYLISENDQLGEGGAKTKYKDNITALSLLARLQQDNRQASPEEQALLVKYVGWGGIPQVFDPQNQNWTKEFAELSELLSAEEYNAARRSTQDAHYTAKPVIEGIYKALERFGVTGGKFLEPAVGNGHFIGLMPAVMRDTSEITGIELDQVTAAIARQLYPEACILNKGFQDVAIPSNFFDVVVGNPPFGNQRLYDPTHLDLSKFSIHNFFVAKSLDKLKEGGVAALVISNHFMDAKNSTVRELVAEHAHFLGAIRLPNDAFKKNALTEVTTDIVFFKKAKPGEVIDKSWIESNSIPSEDPDHEIPLNQYFIDRPDMMLGKMTLEGTMYGSMQPALISLPDQDLAQALNTAITKLPEAVFSPTQAKTLKNKPQITIDENIKIGAYFITPDQSLARRLPDLLGESDYELVEAKNDKVRDRIIGMIVVRDTLRSLMRAEQSENTSDHHLATLRGNLNHTYDRFVRKHGFISSQVNRLAMSDDPDYPLLQALEHNYDRGISKETAKNHGVEPRSATAGKAAIFSKRVITPVRTITHVETAKEALVVSMNETGLVDLKRMAKLCGKDEESLVQELQGLIYLNPGNMHWETADQYLSGNVKTKLKLAHLVTGNDPRFIQNVEALALIQPADIEPVDISIQLGATWIPEKIIDDFVTHLLGGVHRNISYQESLGKWFVKIGRGDFTTTHVTWGTEDVSASTLIESILTNSSIQVRDMVGRDTNGNPMYLVNETKTAVANQKADEIRQAFLDWIWDDKERRVTLSEIYNDRFNTNVPAKYDGSHLTLPGASPEISLRPHQKDAVWRSIQDGTALFDHVVGAGKTVVCVASAMESKRMGLMKKPMFVVPNHLLLQWKDSFYSLYPNANILVAEKTDFTKENRQKLFARIATGDWDAVIVAHSSFKKIGMPKATLNLVLNEQITDLTDAILKIKAARGDRVTIKEMEKARDKMKAKLQKVADTGAKDNAVSFADLGVDALFVDESHEFKNLFISTSLTRISGLGDLSGSDKAFDLFIKARYIQQQNQGRGIFFATGTPISNTIAELYTVQRYMQYDTLRSKGIVHFDAWASTFGSVVTGWELDATGVNYKLNSRFSKFQNVPELISMYRTFADVITKTDLDQQAKDQGKRSPTPPIRGGKPRNVIVERTSEQAAYMGIQHTVLDNEGKPTMRADGSFIKAWTPGSIIHRMENLPKDPRIDNPLKITNDARKSGLDMRLVDPGLPDSGLGKIDVAANDTYEMWKKWEAQKGTQLIFCDLSTPKNSSSSANVVQTTEARQEDDIEEPQSFSMDELLAKSDSFSVYDDFRLKLIQRGIPEHEIRYIHDAKTDLQKAKLFSQVNSGEVRILMGSTSKMGAGTNVQKKLVALRHLDAPWRPSDLEQREGRILRQGNEFYAADPEGFQVEIARYATKQTYDSRMWQTIENKAAGIEQFRKGDAVQRVIEDITSEAANAAEMKAAATGNPLIFLQVQLSADLKKMEALYANHKRNIHNIENRIAWLAEAPKRTMEVVKTMHQEIALRDANSQKEWQFESDGKKYGLEEKDQLLTLLAGAAKKAIECKTSFSSIQATHIPVGKYRGFGITVFSCRDHVQFSVKGVTATHSPENLLYSSKDTLTAVGFIQRLDNFMTQFEKRIEKAEEEKSKHMVEIEKTQAESKKPFQQQEKLELLRKDVREVMVELQLMQKDSSYVSAWKPSSAKLERQGEIAINEVSQQNVIPKKSNIPSGYNPSSQAIAATEHLRTKGVSDANVRIAMYGFDIHHKAHLELEHSNIAHFDIVHQNAPKPGLGR